MRRSQHLFPGFNRMNQPERDICGTRPASFPCPPRAINETSRQEVVPPWQRWTCTKRYERVRIRTVTNTHVIPSISVMAGVSVMISIFLHPSFFVLQLFPFPYQCYFLLLPRVAGRQPCDPVLVTYYIIKLLNFNFSLFFHANILLVLFISFNI